MKPYISDDWATIKGSGLLSSERVTEIETEVTNRTKPLITSGGTVVENTYTLTYPDNKSYLVQTTDHVTLEWQQRNLIAALLSADELKMVNELASTRYAAQSEAYRFERATKVSDRDHSGGVWWGDDYFSEMEEMLDTLMWNCDDPEDIPEYVWAAEPKVVIPSLDVGDVVENWVCDRGWEDFDWEHDLNGVTELQAALDAFVTTNKGVVSYEPDHKLAVVISPETRAELVMQMAEQAKGGS